MASVYYNPLARFFPALLMALLSLTYHESRASLTCRATLVAEPSLQDCTLCPFGFSPSGFNKFVSLSKSLYELNSLNYRISEIQLSLNKDQTKSFLNRTTRRAQVLSPQVRRFKNQIEESIDTYDVASTKDLEEAFKARDLVLEKVNEELSHRDFFHLRNLGVLNSVLEYPFALNGREGASFDQLRTLNEGLRPFFTGAVQFPPSPFAEYIRIGYKEMALVEKIQFLSDRHFWHSHLLRYGPVSTRQLYSQVTESLGQSEYWQTQAVQTDRTGLPPGQPLLGTKVLIVGHFSWEWGEFRRRFGSLLERVVGVGERLTYKQLGEHLTSLGAEVEFFEEGISSSHVSDHVETLKQKLDGSSGDQIVVSRSAGSQVVNAYLKKYGSDPRMKAWMNLGGTPRGSVISESLSRADYFYSHIAPKVLSIVGLAPALQWIGRVTGRTRGLSLDDFLKNALSRENLKSLGFSNPDTQYSSAEAESTLPILNLVLYPQSWHETVPSDDFVYLYQALFGPTEGSSLIADAAVHNQNSFSLLYDNEHLAFRVWSEEEALKVYDTGLWVLLQYLDHLNLSTL